MTISLKKETFYLYYELTERNLYSDSLIEGNLDYEFFDWKKCIPWFIDWKKFSTNNELIVQRNLDYELIGSD